MISKFLVICILKELFQRLFFYKYNIRLHLDLVLVLLLLTVTFFFFSKSIWLSLIKKKKKKIWLFTCRLKDSQKIFVQTSPWYKVCLFSILLNAKIVGIEYPQGICSSIFVVEEFSRSFAHPYTFLLKIQCHYKLMYGILSDFIY